MANYILISSDYRDRILYPSSSDFVIPFGQINSNIVNSFSVLNTTNPLSTYPVYSFCWTNFSGTGPSTAIFTTHIIGGGDTNVQIAYEPISSQLLGINNKTNQPGNLSSYLSQTLANTQDILTYYAVTIHHDGKEYHSTIVGYSPIYSTLTLLEPIPFAIGDRIDIINRTTSSKIVMNGNYNTRIFADNDIYVYDITINEIRKCVLDEITSSLECAAPFSKNFNITDKFLLYNALYPIMIGRLEKFQNGQYYIESSLNSFTMIKKGKGYERNEKVFLSLDQNDNEHCHSCVMRIKKVGPHMEIEELELNEIGCQNFERNRYYYVIPTCGKRVEYATIFINDVSTVFRCRIKDTSKHSSYRPMDFIGNYFTCFLTSPLYTTYLNNIFTSPNNTYPVLIQNDSESSLYVSQQRSGVSGIEKAIFLGENDVLLFVQKLSPDLLDRFRLYEQLPLSVRNSPVFRDALNACVQSFRGEGVVPLNFSGSYITQSQMSCYEMTVLNLILPNVQIDALNSLLTSGYPYVLLEISNVSMPSAGNKNVIYSNNPASISSTFVCSISDVNDPIRTKFIKISSDGAIQIIKFSPVDNLRFRLLLPSGEPFVIKQKDYFPPSVPNPSIQISLMLELKKL
jgi:hypothetical protein